MNLASVTHSVRDLRKRYFRSIESIRSERRLRREIDGTLRNGAKALSLPDFLIIGAPKCATSWLRSALAQHPQVRIVRDEIEYFSSHIDRPLSWYVAHFEELQEPTDGREPEHGRLVLGEKSAGYCGISPARIKLVHRLLPEARLILMVRDPVARHWSHAKRYFSKEKSHRKGYESLDSRQKLYEFFTRTRRFSEFSKAIENWTSVYPADRLLIVSQEAAFASPVTEFERVLRHINVSLDVKPEEMKRVTRNTANSGPVVPMPDDVKEFLERMFAEERETLAGILDKCSGTESGKAGGVPPGPHG